MRLLSILLVTLLLSACGSTPADEGGDGTSAGDAGHDAATADAAADAASDPRPDPTTGDDAGDTVDVGGDDGRDDADDMAVDTPDDAPADTPDDAPVDTPDDAADDVTLDPTIDAPCTDDPPMCTFGCGGDFFEVPECVGGGWVCPPDTIPMDECPPGSCFGLPLPGEVCDEGWQCRPWRTGALDDCPDNAFLCAECGEFDSPFDTGACTCTCDEGYVSCEAAPDPCPIGGSSSLRGVSVEFMLDRCVFTLDEVAAGVTLDYAIVVEERLDEVSATPQDAGYCGRPEASGFIPFAVIEGGDERWCICDTGLCAGTPVPPATIEPGRYAGRIDWDGRNWFGPSDFGNPPGAPFPPGDYTVSVRLVGENGDDTPGGEVTPYEVVGETSIRLVEAP